MRNIRPYWFLSKNAVEVEDEEAVLERECPDKVELETVRELVSGSDHDESERLCFCLGRLDFGPEARLTILDSEMTYDGANRHHDLDVVIDRDWIFPDSFHWFSVAR